MKIKILIVPTLLILAGFVALSFIKPDFDVYMQKKVERDEAKRNAEQAEATARNVNALKGELETQKEQVSFVKRYLPIEKDEARMFDNLNFLTGQAGLITSLIQVQPVEEITDTSQTFAVSADPFVAADTGAMIPDPNLPLGSLSSLPAQYVAPKVEKYGITLEAIGGYANMKELLRKLNGFDRLQELQSFKISTEKEGAQNNDGTEGETGGTGALNFTFFTHLPYQPMPNLLSGGAIVGIPGLQSGSFNMAPVASVQSTITDQVPDTVLGTEGKANPFE